MDIECPSTRRIPTFDDGLMFDTDDFDILESGIVPEIPIKVEVDDSMVKNEPPDSSWMSLKNVTDRRSPKLFRTPNGLQRTATYTTTTSHLYEQRSYMDETSRAVSSVDEPIINDDDEVNYSERQADTEDPVETEPMPSTSTAEPSRPLQRLSLKIGNKVLKFKVIDSIRPQEYGTDPIEPIRGVSSVSGIGFFRCSICKLGFTTKELWSRHTQAQHPTCTSKDFNCVLCGMGFTTKASLSIHHRTHSNFKPYQCTICSKTFSRASNHNLHMKMHQTGLRHFCQVCGRCFKKVDLLLDHQMTCVALMTGEFIHTDRPLRYQCAYCEKLFHHKRDKYIHERIHTGEKPYQCGYCGRGFTQSQGLTIHIRLHTGERPYTCSMCGKHYRDNSALRKHEYKHHVPAPEMGGMYEPELDGSGLLDDDYSNSIWNDRS